MSTATVVLVVLVVAALGVGWVRAEKNYTPYNPFEGMSERMFEADDAARDPEISGRPNAAFFDAFDRGQPHLLAGLDFDGAMPYQDRAPYDGFWHALWMQDGEFWAAMDRGDNSGWMRLEAEHGVRVLPGPVAAPPAGGGRRG